MPKKQINSHSLVAAALVSAVVSGVTTMGALSFAETGDEYARSIITASNTSANPYQPVNVPGASRSANSSYQRPKSTLSKAALERKIKTLKRSVAATQKRLASAEKRLESAEKSLAKASADKHAAAQNTVDSLRAHVEKLEDRYADLNTQLAELQLDLDVSE